MLWRQAQEVVQRCRELAACTEVPGETTRLYVGEAMRQAHARLRGWMEAAGLAVSLDGAGNLRGRQDAGAGEGARRLLIGSHLDTVPNAGAFDGVLGVLAGLAAIEALQGPLPYAVELIGFAEEEGVRFGRPFLGSLALVGGLGDDLLERQDGYGTTVRQALREFGAVVETLPAARLPHGSGMIGFLEIHIEQGPVLESLGLPLGVVDAIAGQTRRRVRFAGTANHAGTTPMCLRHDALAAAAEWISAVERRARATAGLVATVGRLDVAPGAGNVVPGSAVANLDVRHAEDTVREAAVRELIAEARRCGADRGVRVEEEEVLSQAAVAMDAALTGRLAAAAAACGHPAQRMVSGAGHDAMILAREVPAAMLFVRSPGGLSHHPDEDVSVADVEAALDTAVVFLEQLGTADEAWRGDEPKERRDA